jgi:hypothetical protein
MTTGQTKMIIITSNEDLIRQFSLNKSSNTQIIDLDNNNQITSVSKDNDNIINLALLAQLSELVRIYYLCNKITIFIFIFSM